jgi:hypothetical protein
MARGDYAWWVDAPGDDDRAKAMRLARRCERAIKENEPRIIRAALYASVFEGLPFSTGAVGDVSVDRLELIGRELTPVFRNLIRSSVQSEISRVMAVQELLPALMSSGGDFEQQRSAVELTRWLEVLFQSPHGVFDSAADLQRHAAILEYAATGSVGVFADVDRWGDITLRIDDTLAMGFDGSGLYSRPRAMCTVREYAPEDLLELYPEAEQAIWASTEDGKLFVAGESGPERTVVVKVYQGWRMRRGDMTGARLFALKNGTVLSHREYDSELLPCAMSHYERSLTSRFGTPLSQVVWNAQRSLNESLADWSHCIRTTSSIIADYEEDSLIDEGALLRGRAIKAVKRRAGGAPVNWQVPPKGNPESPQFADYLHAAALEQLGIADSTVSGNRTEGVTSGKHQHLTSGIQTERLAEHTRRKNRWRAVEHARVLLMAGVEAREADESKSYSWKKETDAQELALGKLDLEGADAMILTIGAVDAEKDSPQMRLERVEQWVEAGQATVADLIAAEQTYDAKAISSEVLTVQRWADMQVARWLNASDDQLADPGELVQTPEPYLGPENLRAMLRRVAVAHTEARMRNVPEDRLRLFRTFLDRVSSLIKRAAVSPVNASGQPTIGEIDPNAAPAGALPMPGGEPLGGAPLGAPPPPGGLN